MFSPRFDAAHLVVAQMAFNELQNDTELIDSLSNFLNDTSRLFFPDTSDFVSVATWADDLKSLYKNEMFTNWHFVNMIFDANSPNRTLTQPIPPTDNALSTLKFCNESLSLLTNTTADASAFGTMFFGAWCTRWLVHVVADAHQPCHAVELRNSEFPNGDRGCNLCLVNYTADPSVKNMHMFWDSAAGLYAQPYSRPLSANDRNQIMGEARLVAEAWPKSLFSYNQLNDINFVGWLDESFRVGMQKVYLNGTFHCGSNLTQSYVDKSREVAQQRVAMAGYRLAALFRKIAPRHYTAKLPAYCDSISTSDSTTLRFEISQFLFLIIRFPERQQSRTMTNFILKTQTSCSACVVVALVLIIFGAFCIGVIRGQKRASGPHFQKL